MPTLQKTVGLMGLVVALLPSVLLYAPERSALFEGLGPEEFRLLSFHVQGPQHMLPGLWRPLQWSAWGSLIGLAILTLLERGRPWTRPRLRLAALLGVLLLGLGAAWVAVEVVEDPKVTVFQPFRMATIARGLALVLLAERVRAHWSGGTLGGTLRAALLVAGLGGDGAMVVAAITECAWSAGDRLGLGRRGAVAAIVALGAGLGSLARHDPDGGEWPLIGAIVGALVLHVVRRRWSPRWTTGRAVRLTAIAYAVPVLALLAASMPEDGPGWLRSARAALVGRCRFGETPTDDVERLALWCRAHTPTSSRFVGPPGPKTFRLWSRRPLAFNRASSPYHAAGLADWAARFADHVGFDGPTAAFARAYLADRHALERRYDRMTDAELASLARRQGADHVIAAPPADGNASRADGPLELLAREGRYAVYRVRPRAIVASPGGGLPSETGPPVDPGIGPL